MVENLDVSKLPFRRLSDEEAEDKPLAEVREGDVVAIWSRGALRLALVVETTPTRVEVAYTTEGAWNNARRGYAFQQERQRKGLEPRYGGHYVDTLEELVHVTHRWVKREYVFGLKEVPARA